MGILAGLLLTALAAARTNAQRKLTQVQENDLVTAINQQYYSTVQPPSGLV